MQHFLRGGALTDPRIRLHGVPLRTHVGGKCHGELRSPRVCQTKETDKGPVRLAELSTEEAASITGTPMEKQCLFSEVLPACIHFIHGCKVVEAVLTHRFLANGYFLEYAQRLDPGR